MTYSPPHTTQTTYIPMRDRIPMVTQSNKMIEYLKNILTNGVPKRNNWKQRYAGRL